MWGPGDAAAALVGRAFGRHKISLPHADHHKSWEGSAALAVTSFVIGLACLTGFGILPMGKALVAALITAIAVYLLGRYLPSAPDAVLMDPSYAYGAAAGIIAFGGGFQIFLVL